MNIYNNRLCPLIVVIFYTGVLFALDQYVGEALDSVEIGENQKMNIKFEDDTLSRQDRERITTDYISLVKSRKPRPELLELGPDRVRAVNINHAPVTLTKKMRFSGVPALSGALQDEIELNIGLVGVSSNGAELLVITKYLSDAYRNAFAQVDGFNEVMGSLPAYAASLNKVREGWIPSEDSITDLGYFYEDEKLGQIDRGSPNADLKTFVSLFDKHNICTGSLLEVYVIDNRPIVTIYRMQKETGIREMNLHAIYDQSRWKLFLSKYYPGLPPAARAVVNTNAIREKEAD